MGADIEANDSIRVSIPNSTLPVVQNLREWKENGLSAKRREFDISATLSSSIDTSLPFRCDTLEAKKSIPITSNHKISGLRAGPRISSAILVNKTAKETIKGIRKRERVRDGVCDDCGKVTRCMQAHQVSHLEHTIPCSQCDYKAKNHGRMKEHVLFVHDKILKVTCDFCLNKFRQTNALSKHIHLCHMKREVSDKPYACNDCGRRFANTAGVLSHSFTHLGLLPYKCDDCGISFRHMGTLARHKLVHSNKRRYVCDVCDQLLKARPDLKAHMTIHTGERAHECQVCGEAFRVRVLLRNHQRRFNHSFY